MKRFVNVMVISLLVFSAAFAGRKADVPANQKFRVERVIKEAADAVYQQHILSKPGVKSATAAYEPEFDAVLIDSSKNGFGMVSSVTNPISHSGNTFVMAYRQWIGVDQSAGAIGMSYSMDNGVSWTTQAQLNETSPGELVGRYPSAIGAGDYPFIAWSEYVGENTGLESDAKPLYTMDMLGWGGGYLNNPAIIGVASSNPEGLWMGCPDYCEEPDGTGHINMTFTTWREFDANDVSSHNMYLFRSTDISMGSVTFSAAEKILDALEYFEPGSSSGSTTSDALISINNNGVGYVANVAYWHPDYASKVDNNAYHTFKFRKTTDYGQTWSTGSFDTDVQYYYVPDNVFDDNIFDVYLPSQQFEVVIGSDTLVVDALSGEEDEVLDTLNYPGLFIGYDNDMIVDANGGVHFTCLVIPESEQAGYIMPTVNEGCGFYHLYCADPASASAEWEVSFVTSMQTTWSFTYGNSGTGWQSFFPAMAASTENPDILYVVYPKASTYREYSEEDGDTLTYLKSYDIYVNRSIDAGKTWQGEMNVTNTDDFDELNAHADPDATNDHVYVVYQIPDYTTHTVDADESDAVPEDYKNLVYFMDVTYTASGVEEVAAVPASFSLEQNYPNPFNPVSTIAYNIREAGEYQLDVFNTLGQKVTTLFDGYRENGRYEARFDGASLPSGIYFYSLTGNGQTLTYKSVLLK